MISSSDPREVTYYRDPRIAIDFGGVIEDTAAFNRVTDELFTRVQDARFTLAELRQVIRDGYAAWAAPKEGHR